MADQPPNSKLHDQQSIHDVAELLDQMSIFAAEKLSATDEFLPFAVAMSSDGKLESFGLDSDTTLLPSEVTQNLESMLLGQLLLGQLRIYGICTNIVTRSNTSDMRIRAICSTLVNSQGFSARYYIPYERSQFGPILKAGFFRNLN